MEKKWSDFIDAKIRRYLIWVGAGMVAGYLYYAFIGCASGTCPISSSPLWSILYGGVMGWIASGIFEKDENSAAGKECVKCKADHKEM